MKTRENILNRKTTPKVIVQLIYHNCTNQGNCDDGYEMGGNVEEKELLTDDETESNDDMDVLSGSTDEEKYTSSSEDNETAHGRNAFSQSSEEEYSSSRVKRIRKMDKHKMPTSNRLEKVLCSIEELLSNQTCQDENNFCDLFSSYELKKEVFEELENCFMRRALHTNVILSEKEMRFVDVVMNTENLFIISQLMNENHNMMKSILKKVQRYGDNAILD